MKVYNLSSDETLEFQNVSPKFAVQWCAAVAQSRSLEFAAMSEAERDQEFPVTEGSIAISCGDYCTQIDDWQFARKQWESAEKLAYEAKKSYEAILKAEISRKYPTVELNFDYDVYENEDHSTIRYENEEFKLSWMDEDEETAFEKSYPEFYAWLNFRQA